MSLRRSKSNMRYSNSDVFKLEAIKVLDSDIYKEQSQNQFRSVYNQDFKTHSMADYKKDVLDKFKMIKMSLQNKQKLKDNYQQQLVRNNDEKVNTNQQDKIKKQQERSKSNNHQDRNNQSISQEVKNESENQQMIAKNEQQQKEEVDTESILREQEMLFNFIFNKYRSKIEIDRLLEDNQDYIYHIFRLCDCANSDCAYKCEYEVQTGPKVRFKTGMNTSYNQHYLNRDRKYDLQQLNKNLIGQLKKKQVDIQTINRHDFIEKAIEEKNPRFRKRSPAPHEELLQKRTTYIANFRESIGDVRDEGFAKRAIKLILNEGRVDNNQSNYKYNYEDFYETKKEYQNEKQNFKSQRFLQNNQGPLPNYKIEDNNKNDSVNSMIQSVYEPQVLPSMKTKNSINLGERDIYQGMYTSTNNRDFQGEQKKFFKKRRDPFQIAKQKILDKIATLSLGPIK